MATYPYADSIKTADELLHHIGLIVRHLFADEAGKLPEGGRWVLAVECKGEECSAPYLFSNVDYDDLPSYLQNALVEMADEDAVMNARFEAVMKKHREAKDKIVPLRPRQR
jgi:hypothetical protein